MTRLNCLFIAFCLISLTSMSQHVRVETEVGDILVELYPKKAPKTVANFLRYIDGGFYNGGSFYRTVRPDTEVRKDYPIEVIQAGVHPWKERNSFPPISLESTNVTGVPHKAGAISMARTSPDSISKTAMNAVTCQLAVALKRKGIAVNAVCPGWVRTDMGGMIAPRSVKKGAETVVWLATEAPSDETGKFWRDKKIISW